MDVSAGLHFLQGTTARDCNLRVGREGAFWRGRYHPTLIESGPHLSRCVFYIDLNMVRAGVVLHPERWCASGYHELCGKRRRYRLIDARQLIRCIGQDPDISGGVENFQEWYQNTLAEKLAQGYHSREAYWSEAAAIGSEAFVKRFAGRVLRGRIEAIRGISICEDEPMYTLTLSTREQKALWARQQDE
jgi:putative transposase